MKTADLKPCEVCGGPIVPAFFKVRVQQLVIDPTAVNEVLGLNQIFGGNALGLASVMSPNRDAAKMAGEREIIVCQECLLKSELGSRIYFSEEFGDD